MSGIKFNIDEVFEMAVQIERNGGVFYRTAAKNNAKGRALLLKIAGQEDQHQALFEGMRKKAKKSAMPISSNPDGEVSLYLKAMADDHIFDLKCNKGKLGGKESLADIIKIALQAEKDTIAFFTGMKDLIPKSLGRGKMDALIREEMTHIVWLKNVKA